MASQKISQKDQKLLMKALISGIQELSVAITHLERSTAQLERLVTGAAGANSGGRCWGPLNNQNTNGMRVLIFPSREERNKCVKLIWEDSELKNCPYDSLGGAELIVPQEAAEIICRRGIKTKVFPYADLNKIINTKSAWEEM